MSFTALVVIHDSESHLEALLCSIKRHLDPPPPLDLQARRRREVVGMRLGPRARALDDIARAFFFASRAAVGRRREEYLAELRSLRRARSR